MNHDKDSLKVLSPEPLNKLQTASYPRVRRGGLWYPRKGPVPEFRSPLSTANCRVQATGILETRRDYHLAGRTLPQYGQIIDHGELGAPLILPMKPRDDRASLIVLQLLGSIYLTCRSLLSTISLLSNFFPVRKDIEHSFLLKVIVDIKYLISPARLCLSH
jgi:hypothetical protein